MANAVARRLRKRMTPQEVRLWVHLRTWRDRGFHFRRQVPIAHYVVDFACLKQKLVIEIDGGHHGFDAHVAADAVRDAALTAAGFRVLRIWNSEVNASLDDALTTILAAVGGFDTPPTTLRAVPPPRTGEG